MAQEVSWVDRVYTYFVGRDLAYLFAGALLLGIADYAVFDGAHLPREFSAPLIGFLLLSYFVGFSVSEASAMVGLTPKSNSEMKGEYEDPLVAWGELEKKCSAGVLNRHERTVLHMHIGASLGPCSLLAGLVMAVAYFVRSEFPKADQIDPLDFWAVVIALALYGVFMVCYAKRKLKQVGKQRSALLKAIK